MSVLVCGEGLVDLVPVRGAGASSDALPHLVPALGGGPFNVAIAAARLGAQVAFQSRLSTDAYGTALLARLDAEGVDTSAVQRGPEPTTLAVTAIGADGSASYTFYTEGTADRFVEPSAQECTIACFGTVSLALEPGASRYAELLRTLKSRGTLIALDPNIRDFYAHAQHRDFLRGLLNHVDLLKLSEEEVEFLGADTLTAVPVAVVTRGAEGLSLYTRGERLDSPPVPVKVADTIGAGDTIMGALLAQLAERAITATELASVDLQAWREILAFSAAAAAITVSRQGAQPPLRTEVEL